MPKSVEAPPVHLVLRAHPPVPARIGVVYQPLPGRLLKTVLSLAVFWGAAPYLLAVPPHYPWPALSLSLGGWLAYRAFTGKYVVAWFAGECPRCSRPLRVKAGARIDLPHTLTCFACHFEPRLEPYDLATEETIAADERGIRHVLSDCAGTWHEERRWDQDYVTCDACGARHHATPALLAAARAENERGHLLDALAAEGRFLT
ncbi:MAG TPA: hypothetical protein VJT67_08985 [Longimicrobiaceae bacterium]|nr:hypothetical protein [Longimicrobiaceae bacterium]